MSLVYLVLMVAVSAILLFVMAEAVLSVSRRPAWQTPQARLAAEGATLQFVPTASKAATRKADAPAPVAVARKEEEEALAA